MAVGKICVSLTHNQIFRFSYLDFLTFENRGIFSKVVNPKMLKSHRHRLCPVLKSHILEGQGLHLELGIYHFV